MTNEKELIAKGTGKIGKIHIHNHPKQEEKLKLIGHVILDKEGYDFLIKTWAEKEDEDIKVLDEVKKAISASWDFFKIPTPRNIVDSNWNSALYSFGKILNEKIEAMIEERRKK